MGRDGDGDGAVGVDQGYAFMGLVFLGKVLALLYVLYHHISCALFYVLVATTLIC
jgi:hypothetical protein